MYSYETREGPPVGGEGSDLSAIVIEAKDTLSGISFSTGIPLEILKKANGGKDKIQVGQKINLCGIEYEVEFEFTGYCSCKICCKDGLGICKDGTKACVGTLASDPAVVPMGSTVTFVKDGTNFVGTVHDTGNKIIKKKIDVWCSSHKEAMFKFRGKAKVRLNQRKSKKKGAAK